MERIIAVEDYEPLARERLPKDVYDFLAEGAGDEWTLRENSRAFERWILRPRVLRGVAERDTATEVLGVPLSLHQDLGHVDHLEAPPGIPLLSFGERGSIRRRIGRYQAPAHR